MNQIPVSIDHLFMMKNIRFRRYSPILGFMSLFMKVVCSKKVNGLG